MIKTLFWPYLKKLVLQSWLKNILKVHLDLSSSHFALWFNPQPPHRNSKSRVPAGSDHVASPPLALRCPFSFLQLQEHDSFGHNFLAVFVLQLLPNGRVAWHQQVVVAAVPARPQAERVHKQKPSLREVSAGLQQSFSHADQVLQHGRGDLTSFWWSLSGKITRRCRSPVWSRTLAP